MEDDMSSPDERTMRLHNGPQRGPIELIKEAIRRVR